MTDLCERECFVDIDNNEILNNYIYRYIPTYGEYDYFITFHIIRITPKSVILNVDGKKKRRKIHAEYEYDGNCILYFEWNDKCIQFSSLKADLH